MTFDEIVSCLPAVDQKIVTDMMSLFDDISRQTEEFSRKTGLKCKNGCGACCTSPDIETTPAEVLPLAVHLWASGEQSRAFLIGRCVFYKPNSDNPNHGRCGIYDYRPGLCRLFGFAARKDKHNKPLLVTCKVIKDSQAQVCQRTQEELEKGLEAPLMSTHAFAVANIDPAHGQELMPINQAINLAMQKVGYSIQKGETIV